MDRMVPSAVVLLLQIGFGFAFYWTYSEQELWPPTCDGTAQSPIAIIDSETIDMFSNDFVFSDSYYEANEATLKNTGRSVEVRLNDNQAPLTISGGGLKGEYVLSAFHFHWESEHVINGYRYPLEGHFVHYNSKYSDLNTALAYEDGVEVLGVFYQVARNSNRAFNFLSSVIPKVARSVNSTETIQQSVRVMDYLPEETSTFYRYWGSLTSPECNEVVTWTLFDDPSYISSNQVDLFTKTWTEYDERLLFNHRKLQDLNDRDVYFVICE